MMDEKDSPALVRFLWTGIFADRITLHGNAAGPVRPFIYLFPL